MTLTGRGAESWRILEKGDFAGWFEGGTAAALPFLGRDAVVKRNLYVWKAPADPDEVAVGEIVCDRFGEKKRFEHLSLHMDDMLNLFGVDVYRQVASLSPEDEPIPLTLHIGLDEHG
jgi:hypothetical protein